MLTIRQQATYDLILQNTKLGNITTQREIYSNFPKEQFNDGYVWNETGTHDHCTAIWSDIEAINNDPEIERVIITKNFQYWFATNEEQVKEFSNRYMSKAIKSLKRYWNIVKKVEHNGQGKLEFNELLSNLELEFQNNYVEYTKTNNEN